MEEKLQDKNEIIESVSETTVNDNESDEIVVTNKKDNDWFIIVNDNSNDKNVYTLKNFKSELKNGLINGKYSSENKIQGHFKVEGEWKKEDTTVKKFIKDFNELKMLYKPILNHALIGLKWGIYIGIGLKLLDTAILFGSVDPLIGILFIVAIGITFIPKIGTVGMIIAVIVLGRLTEVNLYMAAISAALIGGILGCLPGMLLGGVIGWIRRGNLPKAHDSIIEPSSILLYTIVLPMFGAFGLIYSYIVFFNPWLMSVLE